MKNLIITFLLFIQISLFAHPHLFVKPIVDMTIEDNVLQSIDLTWEWDKWWSHDVIIECDFNGDGVFKGEELKLVYDYFFKGIKDFDYFTYIEIDKSKFKIDTVTNFDAVMNSDRIVTYTFNIPINQEISNSTTIRVRFNDSTIFTAFGKDLRLGDSSKDYAENITVEEYEFYGIEMTFNLKI